MGFFMSRSIRLVSTINRTTIDPLAKRHPNGVSLLRRADSSPRSDDGLAKAQPAVVLNLKRLRKRGHGFKSHPTDCEKPGIKPGVPLVYKAYATEDVILLFVAVFLGYNQYCPGGFMFCVVLYPGAREGSTGSGSGLKASQKTGHVFKSQQTDWEKPGIKLATPGLQGIG